MTRGINVVWSTPRCRKSVKRRRRMSRREDTKRREKSTLTRCGSRRKGPVVILAIPRSALLPRQSFRGIGAWGSTFCPSPRYYLPQPRLMPALHSALVVSSAGNQPVCHVFLNGLYTVSYYFGRGYNQRIPFQLQMLQLFQSPDGSWQCSYLIVTDI